VSHPFSIIRLEFLAIWGRLDHIIRVVREGQTRRAPIERVADILTGYFVPIVTAISVIVWLTWATLGAGGILPEDYLDIPIGGWRES
jgi:cation transport ATPase